VKLVLGDFAPDLDPVGPGIMGNKIPPAVQVPITDANWVFSTPAGWQNMPQPLQIGSPLPSQAFGAFSALVGVTPFVVLATQQQLYIWNSGSLQNQTLSLINPGNLWYFTLYGTDLIAVDGADVPYVSANTGNFTPLGGSPPVFSIIEATDFSLFGIVPNSSTYWFTLNDTLWTPSIATQTGTAALTSTSGTITAARALRGGINLYKRGSFFNGQFSGPPFFWQFTKVSDSIGTPGMYSVIKTDTLHYFWGGNDFYGTDGFSLWLVPNNVRNWVKANMNVSYDYLMYGVYDIPREQLIWWFSSNNASPAGSYDSYVSLSILTGKWSKGNRSIDLPINGNIGPTQAWTWAMFENTYGFWANLPPNLVWGSPIFNGSRANTVGFIDGSHVVNILSGAWATTQPAFITTGYLGDKVNIYRLTRARAGFKVLPGVGPLGNSTKCSVLSTYIEGQPSSPLVSLVPISNYGFYDFVCADRLQQLTIGWYSDGELSDIDVNLAYAGTQ